MCISGVRFPGLTHPGIVGTAPSMELLNIWNEREREVEETGLQSLKLCEVLHSRPLANLPSTKGCFLGKVRNLQTTSIVLMAHLSSIKGVQLLVFGKKEKFMEHLKTPK